MLFFPSREASFVGCQLAGSGWISGECRQDTVKSEFLILEVDINDDNEAPDINDLRHLTSTMILTIPHEAAHGSFEHVF